MRRPLLFVCICLFALMSLVMQLINPPPWNSAFADWEGENIFLIGQVCEKEYRVSFGEEILVLHLKSCIYSKETDVSYHELKQSSEKLSNHNSINNVICEINLSKLPEKSETECYIPRLGEEIFIYGQWQNFAHATNPGGFDLADYYAIEGICGKVDEVEILAAGTSYWPVREFLFTLRQQLLKNLYTAFPQKEASILAKMLLGDGSGLDKEVKELYQSNGIVHILSISGLHITLIGMGLYKILRKCGCPIWIATVFGGVFIVLYGMMTGFSVSAGRAIGMYLIHMLGEIWGKTYDMLTAMGVLAVVLLIDNPLLVYHSGYLLSFGSVCGVGLLAPLLQIPRERLRIRPYESKLRGLCKKRLSAVPSGFATSLSVTLFTLPIQLFFFYKVPVYSVFINLLVIPFMSIVMVVGAAVMCMPFLGFLVPVESLIFAWFEWLCNVFQKLPGHTLVTGRPDMWKILMYYGVLLAVIWNGKRLKEPLKKELAMGLLMAVTILVGTGATDRFWIAFLDVGQGDCIVVHTESRDTYVFDGGSSSRRDVGEDVILPFLQFYGITEIEAVFLSHPDEDHVNGILWLLEQEALQIHKLYLPDIAKEQQKDLEDIQNAAEGTDMAYLSAGDILQSEELSVTCLHPPQGMAGETNAYSLCFLLRYGELDVLLTGDVEGEGEEFLTAELKRRRVNSVEVLKVAHHGSKYSTGEPFLEQLNAGFAVVSCGRNNTYGHPHEETLKRLGEHGISYGSTAENGCIFLNENGYWFYMER